MEVLSVHKSVDGRRIKIEGTPHSLELLRYLIDELLKQPEDKTVRAVNPNGLDIVVELVPPIQGMFEIDPLTDPHWHLRDGKQKR